MKLFMDTEFTGLHKDTTLISIGIISEDGRSFYGECYDYDKNQVDTWIQENVINNTTYLSNITEVLAMGMHQHETFLVHTKEGLRDQLTIWLEQFDSVELVSDVCHYDMVLFIDLFGTAFDIPENVSPVCHDINQDIARVLEISTSQAFNESREGLLGRVRLERIKNLNIGNTNKHNALYDACVIRELYNLFKS